MNRGYLYLILSGLCTLGALFLPGWILTLLCLWIAGASLWFGAGYLSGYGEMMLKSSNGRIPGFIKIFLSPILLVIYAWNAVMRGRDPNPPVQEIREGLYLGRRLFPTDLPLLEEKKVGAILDVTVEFDALGSALMAERFDYLNIPVFDHSRPRQGQLVKAVRWIHERRREGKSVLIHCALGQGRSVTVLLAYLMFLERDKSMDDHMEAIKTVRTTAQPNRYQLSLLKRFGRSDLGSLNCRAALIFNPVAGSGNADHDREEIEGCLSPYFDLKIFETEKDVPLEKTVTRALEADPEIILASGGDGTLSEVAAALAGKNIPLGLIPRGTANALAATLFDGSDGPKGIARSCDRILRNRHRKIDLVEVNKKEKMILLAGIGLEASMVEKADRDLKSKWGPLAYLAGGWQGLQESEPFAYEMVIDGETHTGNARSIVVANAAPAVSVLAQGGGLPDPTDGELDITIVEDFDGTGDALGLLSDLFVRGLSETKASSSEKDPIRHYVGKEIAIKTTPPQPLVIDGEMKGESPVSFRILPGAISILVDE
jgi:diacylglycerol kinase (ATP)